jgi:putative sigma-54 modulation protein
MKITYTGRNEVFPPKQLSILEAKLQKLSKMIDRRGEREAHVILTHQRFLHKVEITINAWDHTMVGVGSNRDLVTAANEALDRLEKQIVKLRTKFRDTTRHKDKSLIDKSLGEPDAVAATPSRATKRASAASKPSSKDRKKVFRVDHHDGKKPMTVDEAMLEMEASQDYMVYRDAKTDRVTVLMRRADGHFDLIES